jgi:hypothetical protein
MSGNMRTSVYVVAKLEALEARQMLSASLPAPVAADLHDVWPGSTPAIFAESTARTERTQLAPFTISAQYTVKLPGPAGGKHYRFHGSASAGSLGDVDFDGSFKLVGSVTFGHARGRVVFTSTTGSIAASLVGPKQRGLSRFPSTLSYLYTNGTGSFTGRPGFGTVDVAFSKQGGHNFITMTFFSGGG